MIPLNYHHLYYFHAVAKAGGVSRASRQLLLAQPTVSAQLGEFERAIGRPLFDRVGRGIVLTETGRLVFRYADAIFGLGAEMSDVLRDRPAAGGSAVQVGCVTGTPRALTDSLLRLIFSTSPSSRVTSSEGQWKDLREDLLAYRIDLVLSDIAPMASEKLESRLAGRLAIQWVGSPQLVRAYSGSAARITQAPMILPAAPSRVYSAVLDEFARRGLKPNVIAEVQDVETARRLAVAGIGIAPLNEHTVAQSQPKGALAVMKTSFCAGLREDLYLIWTKRLQPNPAVQRLVKEFRIPRHHRGA